jgi:hypothetical protein
MSSGRSGSSVPEPTGRGRPQMDMRQTVEGIAWRFRTGAPCGTGAAGHEPEHPSRAPSIAPWPTMVALSSLQRANSHSRTHTAPLEQADVDDKGFSMLLTPAASPSGSGGRRLAPERLQRGCSSDLTR